MPQIIETNTAKTFHKRPWAAASAAGLALWLAGCGASAPTLPTVDESTRRPVNSAIAVELQGCRAETSTLRQSLHELQSSMGRAASCLPTRTRAAGAPSAAQRVVFVYEMGHSRLELDEPTRQALREAAVGAEIIHIHGRSDALQEAPIETQMARLRAEAAAATLVQLGIPQEKLRVTWLGLADMRVAAHERRRVEVDFIGHAPRVLISKAAGPVVAARPAAPLGAPLGAPPASPAATPNPGAQPAQAANKPAPLAAETPKTGLAQTQAAGKS